MYDEQDIVRDTAGRFSEHTHTAPEINLAGSAPLPTALESARERLRLAQHAVQDEVTREVRRVGRTVPGATLVVFETRDDDDGEGLYLRFSHVQDADGELIDSGHKVRGELFALGLDFDVYEAGAFMDGSDAEMSWLDVDDEGINPVVDTKAAVERASDRRNAAAPGSDHWRAADIELQTTSVAAIHALIPDGISELRFAHGEDGLDLIGAIADDGTEIQPWGFEEADIEHYDDIGWFGSNITAPSTYMEQLGDEGAGPFRLTTGTSG